MSYNETIIAHALLFQSAYEEFAEDLDRLYQFTPESPVLQNLVKARMSAVLKNERNPDVLGEFYKVGGTREQVAAIVESGIELKIDVIMPLTLLGAIQRERGRGVAARLRPMLDALEVGQCSLEDISAAVLGEEVDRVDSATLREVVDQIRNEPHHGTLPTGYLSLDHYMGGLTRKHMTILAARPAVGKSDYALSVARNVMQNGGAVYLASLEMDRREILHRLERGAGSESALLSLPGNLRIDDRGALTVPQIAAGVNSGKYDLVIVDHMQLLSFPHRTSGLYEKMTRLSNDLRIAAKHSSAAWLVLSQLSRNTESETQTPLLSHLRDSGAIEQDAYAVLFLHEPEKRDYQAHEREVRVTVAKNRGGSSAQIRYSFEMSRSAWTEL